MNSKQSHGGQVTALILRQQAVNRFLKANHICKFCNNPIPLGLKERVPEAMKKQFCDHSCSAKYSNLTRNLTRVKKVSKVCTCVLCSVEFEIGKRIRKYCNDCLSKNEFRKWFGIEKSKLYPSAIRSHARLVTKDRLKICQNCGWDKFVEVCHVKPVKDFKDTDLLVTINHPDNLILLCPNCHWMFDHPIGERNGS